MYGTGILKGMSITLKRLFTKPTTEFYPFVKKELPPRSRILLAVKRKEDGSPICQACGICANQCPDRVIRVTADPEEKRKAKDFSVNIGRCTFCGLCAEACPFNGLYFTQDFELADYSRDGLIFKLIENGEVTVVD